MQRKDFDSDEELWIYHWLKEAEKYRLIKDIVYQPMSFELAPRASVMVSKRLKTKTKDVDKFLFHPHSYTADFAFSFVSDAVEYAFKHNNIGQFSRDIIIDVKGSFNKFGDQKQFAINQKWVWQKFGIYVEKIVPEKLFKKTWVPNVCRWTPKHGKPVKKYIGVPTIEDFLEKNNR